MTLHDRLELHRALFAWSDHTIAAIYRDGGGIENEHTMLELLCSRYLRRRARAADTIPRVTRRSDLEKQLNSSDETCETEGDQEAILARRRILVCAALAGITATPSLAMATDPEPSPAPRPCLTPPSPCLSPPMPCLAPPVQDLPSGPSRGQVLAALAPLRDAVAACVRRENAPTTLMTRVTFGSIGRVLEVTVNTPGITEEEHTCIRNVVRLATVPPFARTSATVLFPFRIR